MTNRLPLISATVLIAASIAAPVGAARAQQVSVRIDTPEFGVRIGTPYPRPIHAPIYAAPVYAPPAYSPPVYAPPVVFVPAPVYYPRPRLVYVQPRLFAPAPYGYRAPPYLAPGHAYRYWRARHHDHDNDDD